VEVAPVSNVSRKVVLLVAMMSSFLTPFTSSSINVALPAIGATLTLDAVSLNWVATAYLLAAAAFLVPFGRVADIRGRKRIFQAGIVIDLAASILCAAAPSGAWLIFFRALQGLGGAMFFGTSTAILTSVYPANERGRALGFSVASVYTGLSVGPLIGGLLTEHFGWRSVFLANAALGATIFTVVLFGLKGEWADSKGEGFDYFGSILFCSGLAALIGGLSVLPALWGFGLIALALLAFAGFIGWELGQEYPVIKIELFRHNPLFLFSNLAALINYSATFAVTFLLSLYLQYVGGFAPAHVGLILVTQPVVMVICSLVAGSIAGKVEPRVLSSAGMALTTAGLAMLAFLNGTPDLTWVFVSQFVLGAGFGFFSSPNINAAMSSVGKKSYGVAAGILSTMRLTGQALSLGLVLMLMSWHIGRVGITPANHANFIDAMRIAFATLAGISFFGIFASAARGKSHEG
jgi:EmrB/QacA subfamily drug resistance transporter